MADTVIITGEKTVTVVTVGVQGPAGVSGSSVPATTSTIGGIIVGDNLTITGNGVLSVADTFQPKTSCVTYGLTDTLLPNGPNTFYVVGEHVVQSGRNFYTGLRGRKTSAGVYQNATSYGVGGYTVDSNGTPTGLSTLETSASGVLLSSANLTTSSLASTVSVNSAGYLTLTSSNGSSAGSCSLSLQDGAFKVIAGGNTGFMQLTGNNNPLGLSISDYTFMVAGSSNFDKGVSIQRRTTTSSLAFPYNVNTYSNGTYTSFDFSSGFSFYDGGPTGAATEFQHKYTNRSSNVTSSTTIRLVSNNAELSYAEMIQVKTANSILTQGYADTRYLTSADLTYANLTGTPTTLAGYGITDGLTSANLTPYLTISSANSTYSVLGHTHSIANVTGLQTALDAKLPSANFTYANLTGTPNLTLYLTTANASSTYQPLGNYATTSCLTFANLTGKPTTLSGYGITDGLTSANAAATYSVLTHTHVIANVTGLQTALDSKLPSANFTYANLTGPQNLLDTELIRAKLRDYSETVSSPTISAGTLTLNLETSNIFTVSLNAAITTLTISNPPASGSGGSFTLIFTADGTARAVTWPASIKWAGGTAPTITSTSGKVDSFAFFTSDGGTNWQGYVGGQNF